MMCHGQLSRSVVAIALVCAAGAAPVAAQENRGQEDRQDRQIWWAFEDRRYFDPHAAEPRAAQLNALGLAFGKAVPWLQKSGDNRRLWDIDVGAEFPIVGQDPATTSNRRVGPREFGWGTWLTVDFHLLSDHRDPSSPILNTDYRFSGMAKAQYGIAQNHWVGARLQAGHESTHLGDEYSLAARRLFEDSQRINVSYEFLDFGVGYDGLDWPDDGAEVMLRAGTIFNLKGSYYKADTLEAPGARVAPSVNRHEPYLGMQYRDGDALRRIPRLENWGAYVSLDLRWRSIYDYREARAGLGEERQWSVNVLAGISKTSQRDNVLGAASPYVRVYHGVNPHGQFRNQRDFWLYGFGIRLDR